MFFSVTDLELRKARFDVSIPPGEIEYFDAGLRQATPLLAEGSVELIGTILEEIRVEGRLKVTMEADCDRCLESARYPIDTSFDLYYRPARLAQTRHADEVEIDEGEAEIAFYEGGLELRDILREQILLEMPMQRVCSETCKGICPICGRNRNTADCGCRVKPADDRWAALKNLTTRGI